MDEKELSDRATVGLAATRKAGLLAADLFRRRSTLAIEHKGKQDFVSEADRASESLLIGELSRAFPSDSFLGEEGGPRGSSDVIWIIDPIDGTTNFLNGIHFWCVSVGLVVAGEPMLGFIYDPVTDEMFSAVRGMGAKLNGAPIQVSSKAALSEARISLGFSYRRPYAQHARTVAALLEANCEYCRFGSGALGLAYTAAGRWDGYWEQHLNSWDAAAGILLVREAGGRTNDYFAADFLTNGNEALAATPRLFDQLRTLVGAAA